MPGIEDALGQLGSAAGGPAGLAVSASVQGATALAQLIQARQQNQEARRLQSKNVRPMYRIQQGYLNNLRLAESRASQGLSDAAMIAYENNADRSMGMSVDAILRGGGDINSIGDLYDNSLENAEQLAMLEDEVRMKREQTYMLASERLADEMTTQWQVNEYAPFKDNQQAIASLRKQSNDSKWKGINTIGNAVQNYVMANQYNEGNGGGQGRTQPPALPGPPAGFNPFQVGRPMPGPADGFDPFRIDPLYPTLPGPPAGFKIGPYSSIIRR